MEDLRAKYRRRLQEAAAKEQQMAADPAAPQDPAAAPPPEGAAPEAAPAPEAGPQDNMGDTIVPPTETNVPEQQDPSLLGGRTQTPTFPTNPHRFTFQAGETVAYFDEQGQITEGQIDGPPVGNKYQISTTDGRKASILKSELFYGTQQQAPVEPGQQPDQGPGQNPAQPPAPAV